MFDYSADIYDLFLVLKETENYKLLVSKKNENMFISNVKRIKFVIKAAN